jgi:tripartite ATP-independent transporter DctP family solute receptor
LKLYSDGGVTSPYGAGANAFAEELTQRTDGRYRIEPVLGVAAAGQALGSDRAQGRGMVDAVRSGDADLVIVSSSSVGDYAPETRILDLPFLFRDSAHARAVLDGPFGQRLLDTLQSRGFVGLAWGENGFRHLTNNKRAIRTPEHLQGLSIRVQENEIHRQALAALGARPVSMPVLREVMEALRQGTLDGQENAIWVMASLKIAEVQKHLSLTGHFYQPVLFLMSLAVYDRLTSADRAAFVEAARHGAAANRRKVEEMDAAGMTALRAAGIEIVEDIDRATFEAVLAPAYAEWGNRFGVAEITRIHDQR